MRRLTWALPLLASVVASTCSAEEPNATNLRSFYRDGQVFLQWDEPDGLDGVRFRVLSADRPITDANAGSAMILGDWMLPGSSTDWWLNPETYGRPLSEYNDPPEVIVDGWLLEPGGQRIEPGNGLFVHTVTDETAGERYYAVVSWPEGSEGEIEPIVAGVNSLTEPIAGRVAPVRPIWQGDPARMPAEGAGADMPLDLVLHAKRGRGGMDWLVFGDRSLGWRESLPFKFGAEVIDGAVRVAPTDRHWIDRILIEGNDACQRLTPAIHTFWSGYNTMIFDPERMDQGTCVMFAERRVLWIVDWVQRYFGTDPARSYARGSSMGGCGGFSIALRHPEVFAAIASVVGITTYAAGEGGDSTRRVTAYMGDMDTPTDMGMTVREWLDSTRFVMEHDGPLPFVIMANGRNDTSIPWWATPPFYDAMQQRRQGLIAAWNTGGHGDVEAMLPDDIRERMTFDWMHRFATNRSYPVITDLSTNDDPGDGPADDGDPEGYINRGIEWDELIDEPDRYEVLLTWHLDAAELPCRMNVTPRRIQNFTIRPGERIRGGLTCMNCGKEIHSTIMTADENGLVTYRGFRILVPEGSKMTLTRAGAIDRGDIEAGW